MAATTKAASPLEQELVMYLLREGVELSEEEVCRLTSRHCKDRMTQILLKLLRDGGAACTDLQQCISAGKDARVCLCVSDIWQLPRSV